MPTQMLGSLTALNGADGKLLWKIVLPDGEGFFPGGEDSYFSFVPQVVGGVVYAVAEVDTATVRVYAYRAADGKLLWRSATIKNLGAFFSPPAIGNGAIYLSSDNGTVTAISTPAGSLLWQYNAGQPVYASPQVADGLVYISPASKGGAGSAHQIIALDAAHGTVRWKQVLRSDIGYASFQFALHAGLLYLSGYADTTVTALNAASGAVLWRSTYAPYHGGSVGPGGLLTVAP
jgi:eukaryotic-like serine/threonine-protein kinase